MTDSPDSSNACCCENRCPKHYPRYPYFLTDEIFDECCAQCDKPGIGSADFQGGECSPCICCPCALIVDILCCPFMIFGFIERNRP